MTTALKPLEAALDILYGKRLNPHYVAWRERVARIANYGFRVPMCNVCGGALGDYYAGAIHNCPQHRAALCREHMDEHYREVHNPETHAMEPGPRGGGH